MGDILKKRIVFLDGKRLYLRPRCESDVPRFFRWFNDPEVTVYLPTRYPTTEEDEKQWIRNPNEKDDQVILTIVLKNKSPMRDCPIGVIGIHSIEQVNRIATIGITIGEKRYWGNGYAMETELLLLEYVFNTLNLRKIYARVLAVNKRSCRHFKKSGYKLEATLSERHFCQGRYVDEYIFSIDRAGWQRFRDKPI